MLAARFMETRTFQRGARKHLTDAAMDALTAYEWPGNIRELRNVIERAILVSGESDTIEIGDLALPSIARASDTMNASVADCEVNFEKEPTLEEIKAKYLGYLIARHQGHRGRIANILGVSERNTYRMVKKFGLEEK